MIPSATEERALTLRRTLKLGGETFKTPWISSGLVLSVVFFVLALNAISAAYGLAMLMGVRSGAILGILAILLAEVLIHRFKLFGTGVEAALWLAGGAGIVFDVVRSWEKESLLALGVMALVASFRLRNAWFMALATGALIAWVGFRTVGWQGDWTFMALLSMAIAFAACAGLSLEWQRPSSEWMLIAVAVASMLAGAICTFVATTPVWPVWLLFAVGAVTLGIRARHHVPLLAALAAVTITAIKAHELVALSVEGKLFLAGLTLVGVAAIITRLLRDRTTGLVLEPAQLTPVDEALQTIATIALQPQVSATPQPEVRTEGGGGYGGAGATGEF